MTPRSSLPSFPRVPVRTAGSTAGRARPAACRQREVAGQGTRPGTSQAQSVARGGTVMVRTLPAELGVPAMSKYAFPALVLSGLAAS
jgi:hypothetical protein